MGGFLGHPHAVAEELHQVPRQTEAFSRIGEPESPHHETKRLIEETLPEFFSGQLISSDEYALRELDVQNLSFEDAEHPAEKELRELGGSVDGKCRLPCRAEHRKECFTPKAVAAALRHAQCVHADIFKEIEECAHSRV